MESEDTNSAAAAAAPLHSGKNHESKASSTLDQLINQEFGGGKKLLAVQ